MTREAVSAAKPAVRAQAKTEKVHGATSAAVLKGLVYGAAMLTFAVLLFLIGLLVLFAGRVDGFIGFMILAWLVSPYGLPLVASWLTERVADFNQMLKSI